MGASEPPCGTKPNSFTMPYCSSQQNLHLPQQDAALCTEPGLGFPYYNGTEQAAAFDGEELELCFGRASKATKVDYLSSPCQNLWPLARADVAAATAESSRARKQRFRDVLESCKQKVEAMEAMESPVAFQESEVGVGMGDSGGAGGGGGGGADGMRLVQLLVACAEAVACRDRAQAAALLRELQSGAPVHGTAFQRVASCFVQGLADRLALAHPPALGPASMAFCIPPSCGRRDGARGEALALAYELCPYLRFAHFVANASILETFEGESNVHVVDLGMTLSLDHGHQWRGLLDGLAARAGAKPARVRVTGVGAPMDTMRAIGRELEAYAEGLGMRLEFRAIDRSLESLHTDDLGIGADEAVAINSILELHCVVKESRGALNSVLQTIRKLSPKAFVLVEQDAGHNGPFFLGRFMEALHYYAAVFDALDAELPRYDARRARVEQFHFGAEIRNVVGCEGAARVERHERADQWRRRMSRAGFQSVPIRMAAKAREWLQENAGGGGYTVAEEKGCLVLGWKGKPIIAASYWKC
ncbi:GRAS family protein RAD1-like [Phragmites australis]|uniref:GRAS family protein RAD1-like n=1 Tax=Phragmites australis TaxID=29695 RepID=UPI002D77AE3E|nr:GRAS family protein RAD1-like [Phragmites australis]